MWMKINSPIFFIIHFWVITKVVDLKKKISSVFTDQMVNDKVVSKDAQYSNTDFFVHEFFFVRLLVIEI